MGPVLALSGRQEMVRLESAKWAEADIALAKNLLAQSNKELAAVSKRRDGGHRT